MVATIAYFAALLTALSWGAAPVVAKRGLDSGGNPLMLTVVALSTGTALFWGILAATQGQAGLVFDLSPRGYALFVVGGIVGTALGRILGYTGIQKVGASINSAVTASNPLIATVLAAIFIGEVISAVQGVGVVVVVAGLAVLTISEGGDLGGWTWRDLLFPLGAAFAYGAGAVIRRYGLTTTPASPLEGVAINETTALVTLGAFLVLDNRSLVRDLDRRTVAYYVASGVFIALGIFFLFTGLNNGPVAIVVTISGTYTLFASLFSYLLLRDLEKVTRGVVIGATLVVVGIAIISLL